MIARQMVAANLAAGTNRATLNVDVNTGPSASTDGGTVSSSATANANPGEIDCGPSCFTAVDAGTVVNLSANPNPGYHLLAWSGACTGSAASCSATVNGLTGVTATFMPNVPTVYVADASSYEGKAGTTHAMKFKVLLSGAQAATTTVHYSTVDGSATAGSDYVAKTGTVSIPAGGTTATIPVTVNGDAVVEGDETLGLSITSVSGAAQGTSQATGTILDDDTTSPPTISVGDARLVEGNSGTQNEVFPVTLSSPSTTPTPVQFETANGTATAGSDYTAKTGTITIAAGAVSGSISIPVKGDTTPEGTETYKVNIIGTGTSGVPVDRDTGTGTIIDDDTAATTGVSIGDASVVEGHTGQKTVSLTVTLSAAQATTTSVKFHTVDGTATADGDYVGKTGTLSILAGKRTGIITVAINGDTSLENGETLTIVLDGAGAVPLVRPTGTLTILNDD